MPTLSLNINGFALDAHYSDDCYENVMLPLLLHWTAMQKEKGGRIIIALAAAPATGKTTFCQALAQLSRTTPGVTPIDCVGLDGFHYHADYIATHTVIREDEERPMKRYKGSWDTFDAVALGETLRAQRMGPTIWPIYDRNLHDVIPGTVATEGDIILLEGNWLLLKDPAWEALLPLYDETVFITADPNDLRQRLIDRKVRGGSSVEDATAFVDGSDFPNTRFCIANSHTADIMLAMDHQGNYIKQA